jgi:hypothetical protein
MARRKPGIDPASLQKWRDEMAAIASGNDPQLLAAQREKEAAEAARSAGFAGEVPEFDENGRVRTEDLGIYQPTAVAQVANKPDNPQNYGQGPGASTRLCGHVFVKDASLTMTKTSGVIMGYAYVRFHKNGTKGPNWRYGPMTYQEYVDFARSNSKGHHINAILNSYPRRPATGEEVGGYMGGIPQNSGTDNAGIRLQR